MKKHRLEGKFLEQVKLIPNISLACDKVGLSRNTVYRWCNEDSEFKKRLDEALKAGIESVNDLAESKLIAHLNNGNMQAIRYWLDNNKQNYARPRPRDFWDEMFRKDNPIVKVHISRPEDPEKVIKDQERRLRKK